MAFRETPKRTAADHHCEVCRKVCGFGVGFDDREKWYCREHVPADFFLGNRQAAPSASLNTRATAAPPPQAEPSKAAPAPSQADLFGSL